MNVAPNSRLIVAKFAGRCACGAKFAAGAQIAWSKSYDYSNVGCAACDFGTFPGVSPEALLAEARGYMALADNAINMRATDGSVGRLLTRNELAAAALRAHRRAA
jgi:hypothetical protein